MDSGGYLRIFGVFVRHEESSILHCMVAWRLHLRGFDWEVIYPLPLFCGFAGCFGISVVAGGVGQGK